VIVKVTQIIIIIIIIRHSSSDSQSHPNNHHHHHHPPQQQQHGFYPFQIAAIRGYNMMGVAEAEKDVTKLSLIYELLREAPLLAHGLVKPHVKVQPQPQPKLLQKDEDTTEDHQTHMISNVNKRDISTITCVHGEEHCKKRKI